MFRFTHNLEELGTGLAKHLGRTPKAVEDAAVLTKYAIFTRYPGLAPPVEEAEFRNALRLAEAVVAWAQEQIAGPAASENP